VVCLQLLNDPHISVLIIQLICSIKKAIWGCSLKWIIISRSVSTLAGADVRLGFRVYGGLNYLGGGDLNRGMEGIADTFKLMMILENIAAVGEYSPAHLGMDIGGDLILEFRPSFGVSLGAGSV
jgi:hypothetical protein